MTHHSWCRGQTERESNGIWIDDRDHDDRDCMCGRVCKSQNERERQMPIERARE